MSKALSLDLRIRVLSSVSEGMSHRAAAGRFGVSAASVSRWRALERDRGDARPKALGGDRRSPSSPHARATMPRTKTPWRRSKKLPRPPEGGPRQARRRCRGRGLVAGRSACRAEEQDHPALGQTRHTPVCTQGPAHDLGLYLRRHMPEERQGRRPCHAPGRHTRDERPPRRNRPDRRPRRACRGHPRPRRVAHLFKAPGPRQHHPAAAPAASPGTQPGRECLAVLARQLALKPRLRRLRRHPRSLLRGLEQTLRSAPAHRLYRNPVERSRWRALTRVHGGDRRSGRIEFGVA